MAQAAVKLIVTGLVQGVGYRFFAVAEARQRNLVGYVKNLSAGGVEAFAEGERGLLEDFLKVLKIGPVSAQVFGLSAEWLKPQGKYQRFGIEY